MQTPFPGLIAKVSTLADNTLRLVVDCQELPSDQMAELFVQKGKPGWLIFHEKPITEIDPKDLPDIKVEKWEKHPSQRQRAIIFRLWEQEKTELPFEHYYKAQMEKINEWLKSKLND